MLHLCNSYKWHIMAEKNLGTWLGQAIKLWRNVLWCSWTAIVHY
ncbi:rCG30834, isoform CRA_a [Rattus norvegicus]|uniref:RCG30834, isoform CRA_a n=1 Tax=Rattus norvegicus TaxID=10116 RepID=A6ISC1_RAT|nr:rCG30834, isoform CRA_a [Rattus norvegicus]